MASHGNHPHWKLKDGQPQSDAIYLFRTLVLTSRVIVSIHHVYGHMDEVLYHNQLSYDEMINCLADQLANDALAEEIASGHFIPSNPPFEDVRVSIGGGKLREPYGLLSQLIGDQRQLANFSTTDE